LHTELASVCIHVHGPGQLGRYSDLWWDRIPVGAKFFAPVQTSPGANLASYTMDTGSFPGIKRPGRDADHPPTSSAEFEGRVELYVFSLSGPSWPVLGWSLPLPLCIYVLVQ